MKKTLIASAVAAAALSTPTFAMDAASELAAKLDSMPTVYGNVQLAWVYGDEDPGGSSSALVDNGSTIGFKHSHEISPGLTGFVKVELEFDADDKYDNGGLDSFDEAYIGVKGDFGKAWVGSDDSTYERATDVISNYWELGDGSLGAADYDTGEGDLIQYTSPAMAGLEVGVAVQINGDAEKAEKSYPYQISLTYSLDALTVALAMDSNDGDRAYKKGDGTSPNNSNSYGLLAAYEMGDFSITGEYHTRSDVEDSYGLMGAYSMGANTFAAGYVVKESDSDDAESSGIALQALHNLSDHMYVYTEAYFVNTDSGVTGSSDVDTTALALGATYLF